MKKKKTKRDIYAIYDRANKHIQFHVSYGKKNKRKMLTYDVIYFGFQKKITSHHSYAVLALRDLLSMYNPYWTILHIYTYTKHMYINANITPISI